MTAENGSVNVLIIDDEENIRMAVERILSRVGCLVFQAGDGEEGLRILQEQKISIVFLDLKMPGMDGMQVQKQIHELDPSILVIIITGYATIETAIEAMKQGAYDFIPKPFEADQLRIVAKRAMEKIYLTNEARRLEEEQQKTLFDLSTEKSRSSTIVEAMPNGVLVTNSQGQVVLMNQAFKEHFNLDQEFSIGGWIQDYIQEGSLCSFVQDIVGKGDAIKDEIPSMELELSRNIFLLVRARPILSEQGSFLGVVVIFVDISAIKQLDRLKSEFVAKVSHELRSPLSTIHEQMALVIQDMLQEEQNEHDQKLLTRMKERTRGMISLVEDLLDLSRLEAGAAYQDLQWVKLEDALASVHQNLQSQAEEKQQKLELILPDKQLPQVYADPKALESIFFNLAHNAVKYTPDKGTICIKAEDSKEGIKVHFEDNGLGIEPKDQERIFERFYRVKNEKTRFISGTGLGLPIVKGILDDLGGSIYLHSQPGSGSTFTVCLPAAGE